MNTTSPSPTCSWWVPLWPALASLLPPFIFWDAFHQLFWFGDEWQLMDEIQRFGFGAWAGQVFAENFAPVFKVLWGGALVGFGGSYFAVLLAMWLTHATAVYCFGRVLQRYELPSFVVITSQLVFGLSPTNMETLTWCVQWSPVLAMLFMLMALNVWISKEHAQWKGAPKLGFLLFSLSALSALSFSRGVLTGGLIALAAWIPLLGRNRSALFTRVGLGAAALVPSVATMAVIFTFSSGNHQGLAGHWNDVVDFAIYYFSLNPLRSLAQGESWGSATTLGFAIIKISAIIVTFAWASPKQRIIFTLLLAYDLGNSLLLGVGRHHTGLPATVSSRYQYSSLISSLPFYGFAIWRLVQFIPISTLGRRVLLTTTTIVAVTATNIQWPSGIKWFGENRGATGREVVHSSKAFPDEGAIPGIPFMRTDRARELTVIYSLH